MTDQANVPRGSGALVTDYNTFCEGDTDPYLQKQIGSLIYKDASCIVYLDEDLFVEWGTTSTAGAEYEGEILNRVAELQALPIGHLPSEQQQTFRMLVGEAVARVLRRQGRESAASALDRALLLLEARNREIARWWYLVASGASGTIMAIALGALWTYEAALRVAIGDPMYEVAIGACAGGVGALLSILIRRGMVPRSPLEPAHASRLQVLEGIGRIAVGVIGAGLVALAVKGGLLLSASTDLPAMLTLCAVAGASERMVPSFIERIEIGTGEDSRGGPPADPPNSDTPARR